jgi:hypothetical protein
VRQAHDPEKLVLDVIGDGNRFSEKIMRQADVAVWRERRHGGFA